jgi:two-component system nitrate/nitrite response regulator NarL
MEESPATIDIVISDDHEIFREGVRRLLEVELGLRVVGEAIDGEDTVRVVRQLNPHILLLDLSLPKMTGLEALRELGKLGLQTRIIILTAAIEREQVVEALQLGAHGIVLKHSAIDVLLKSIRCVSTGQHWVDQENVTDLIQAIRSMAPPTRSLAVNQNLGVTARELQIVALIVAGYTNRDIARKLTISEHTVKHHLTNIFDRLGVSNRLELVLYAIDHRLVDGE